jgi:hypothetical protein
MTSMPYGEHSDQFLATPVHDAGKLVGRASRHPQH